MASQIFDDVTDHIFPNLNVGKLFEAECRICASMK